MCRIAVLHTVFFRRRSIPLLKAGAEVALRGKAHIFRDQCNGVIGVPQKIRGVTAAFSLYILLDGDPFRLLEFMGQVGTADPYGRSNTGNLQFFLKFFAT